MALTKQIGATESLDLSVYIALADGTGGKTGLAAVTLVIINPDGTKLSQATDTFTETNSVDAPGVYEISVPYTEFTQLGFHQIVIDAGDATADNPEPGSFERLSAPSATAPSGDNLTTLAAVQDVVGTTDATQDARIETLITQTSAFIERYCRRKFTQQEFTETSDGLGGEKAFVQNPPIQSLTSVSIDGTAQTVGDFEAYTNEGYIWTDDHIFTLDRRNVIIVYQGGYASLPQEIVEVATEMVAYKFKQWTDRRIGITSELAPDGSRTFLSGDYLPGHLERLDRYVLRFGLAS